MGTRRLIVEDFWPSTRPQRAGLIVLLVLSMSVRGWHSLTLLPIMIDETIYLRWAETIHHQHQFFISLLDAKPQLTFWLLAIVRMVWDGDPLPGARIVSVLTGGASTLMLFATGSRLAGPAAGLTAALLYTVLPYGVFYDRIASTDTFVNLFGVTLTYVSLVELSRERPGIRAGSTIGLLLGLGYLMKPTALLFAAVPPAVGVATRRGSLRCVTRPLVIAGMIAAAFPLLCHLAVPSGPTYADHNMLMHRTSFFTPLDVFLRHSSSNLSRNTRLLFDYICAYTTVSVVVGTLGSVWVCATRRKDATFVFLSACLAPITVQLLTLEWFPSRYVFPHAWPCVLIVAVALATLLEERPGLRWRLAAVSAVMMVAMASATQSYAFLTNPASAMAPHDADEHLGSGIFSGVGIRPAIEFMEAEARGGSFTLLTDPIWGPPADTMYPYLNHRHGIRVYDAWWMQLSETHPILPHEPKLVSRSQYERVPDGVVDFPNVPRVMYVTATNYNTPVQVARREPAARLIARFPRPNGREFIDVYRLR